MSPVTSSWNGPDPRGGEWGFPASTPWPPTPFPRPVVPPPVKTVPPPESPGEPVVIAHSLTTVLAAVVTAGWVAIPNATINAVISVVGFAVSTVGVVLARSKVSPVKDGIWTAIQDQLGDLVAAELARQQKR